MEDDFEGMENLMDDDPALDYVLYEEMEAGRKNTPVRSGCLTVLVILMLPVVSYTYLIIW